MLWTVLAIVIVLAAVAYIALTVRRARHEHRARSDERAALLLAAMHGHPAESRVENSTLGPITLTTATATLSNAAEAEGSPAPSLAALRRPRFLTDSQRLLYLI